MNASVGRGGGRVGEVNLGHAPSREALVARIVVAGLGAAGAAAAWHLSASGHTVIGLERWRPPHPHGSSHGETRLTRVTAFEGPQYVPLAQRAHELWRQLERQSGQQLFEQVGVLFVGQAHETIVAGTAGSAQHHAVACQRLSPGEAVLRLPGLRIAAAEQVLCDPGAGILRLEQCLGAFLSVAARAGAELRFGEPMLGWEIDGDGVSVETAQGRIRADALIIAMGAWMPPLLEPLGLACVIERQTMHWFEAGVPDEPDRPVLLASDGHDHATVIFPPRGGFVKVAGHGSANVAPTPEAVDREVHPEDIAAAATALDRWLPGRHGALHHARTCLYTRTPQGHFLLDRHPAHPQVVLASPCNGFGFKFAPATGELLAALALREQPRVWSPSWRFPQR